jgi:hypothetical protein
MILSFPGGAGGNWLNKVISNQPILSGTVNFHYRHYQSHLFFIHETDTTKFDYLYSGESYFNFYINALLKCFIHEQNIFNAVSYKESFLTCVNTARYICKYEQIKEHIFLNFDDLINSPEVFLGQVNRIQDELKIHCTNISDFIEYQKTFISTCVNPINLYENFDNMFWVCFVIGQLMNYDCVPDDFIISDPSNQHKCKKFAEQNYHRCKLNKVHFFDTNIHLPESFNK